MDVWASGQAYEPYVGRWSHLVASEFIEWLSVPPGKVWLDIGCGTGALTRAILQQATPQAVKGIDAAKGYIDFANQMFSDERVRFQLGDAQALPVSSAAYDAVVSGLVLNFVPQPAQMIAEMVRAARPGAPVAVYVWDYAGEMQFMRHFWDAATLLDPAASALDEGKRFPICNPGPLADLYQRAGLTNVEVRPIDVKTIFKDFDDFWLPFLGGQGPAPTYAVSLNEYRRAQLRDQVRSKLPFASDGSIPLVARAWAVRGVR